MTLIEIKVITWIIRIKVQTVLQPGYFTPEKIGSAYCECGEDGIFLGISCLLLTMRGW
jgi:hypothetical protein